MVRVDVLALLAELKLETRRSGGDRRGHCPAPAHASRPGSAANLKRGPGSWEIVVDGPRSGQHICHACGFGGGPVALVRAVLGVDPEEAVSWLAGRWRPTVAKRASPTRWPGKEVAKNLRFPPGSRPVLHPRADFRAADWLKSRGVTDEEIEAFGMLTCATGDYRDRVIIPIVVAGELVDFVARLYLASEGRPKALSGRARDGAAKALSLFGYDHLDPEDTNVYVTEGVWGALAIRRLGFRNVVACCGSAWSLERTELLRAWPRVVLVPDGDGAGSKLEERAVSLRYDHQVRVVDLPRGEQPDTVHPTTLRERLAYARLARFPHFTDPVSIARWSGKGP